jgi:hypothetical protein
MTPEHFASLIRKTSHSSTVVEQRLRGLEKLGALPRAAKSPKR